MFPDGEARTEGLSLQAMAGRLNAEGVLTISGKGRWQKGTIGNLIAQSDEIHDGRRHH